MTGLDHEPEDYTHPSWDWSKSELMIEMVQGTREGGTNGAENVECPKTTAVETDEVTCGVNNVVGGDCTFTRYSGGVGICAQNGTSSQIECWDACDYSLKVETYIVGAPEGTRSKIEYKRSQQCPSWWFTVLKVLGLIILVVMLLLGVAYLCFRLRNTRQKKKTRALEKDMSRESWNPPPGPGYQNVPTTSPQPSLPPGPPLTARNDAPQMLRAATTPMFTTAYTTSPAYATATYAAPTTQSRASVNSSYSGFATYQPGAMVSSGPGLATGQMYTAVNTHSRAEY